jgi:hypothetical protein
MSPRLRPLPWRPALSLLALLVLLGAAGCSSNGSVTGKVTYKGAPLGSGTVVFIGPKASATADLDAEGNYTILKAPLGAVRVTVETMPPPSGSGGGGKDKPVAMAMDASGGPSTPQGKYVPIPAKYKDPSTSGLTYTVVSGKQTHDIPLD